MSVSEHKPTQKSSQIKSVHEVSMQFLCKLCDYRATQNSDLLKHFKSIHEDVKFSCKQFDYRATQKGSLLSHTASVHECQFSMQTM